MRWTQFRCGCPSRAKICSNLNVFSIIKEHKNHDASESQIAIGRVKRKAENSHESLRKPFDEEANESEVGGQISFVRVESTMYKRRWLNRPLISMDADNAVSLIEICDEEFKAYH